MSLTPGCLILTDFQVSRGKKYEVPSSSGRRLIIEYYIGNNLKSFEITRNQGGGSYHSSFTSFLR